MEVRVFWIGKTRLTGVAALTDEYSKRLGRFCEFRAEEVRSGKRKGGSSAGFTREEAAMAERCAGSSRIVLDPAGRQWNSEQFAGLLQRLQERGTKAVSFCVGGAEGFSTEFRTQADLLLSISSMTMPHELARVVLLEQIYRAWTLLSGHPYPK
jgi:23S rRNA (pseudouridine1915-N3)-methyltransferase